MMSAETLLSMLDKVRKTGPDRYIARCPSHDDKSPSLTIRESDDGKVLVHCFAGCSVHEIVHAVGLELSDLFPPRQTYGKPQHRAFSAADALRCLSFEGLVVAAAGRTMLSGTWNEKEQERLTDSVGRINAAMTVTGVSP